MARVYATSAQAWPEPGTAPANADLILRVASRVIDRILTGVVYEVDAAGLPTDPDVAQALQDACVVIALEIQDTGVLDAGGTTAWDSVSIGSVSLSGKGIADGAVAVGGITVPPAALFALVDVGPRVVITR